MHPVYFLFAHSQQLLSDPGTIPSCVLAAAGAAAAAAGGAAVAADGDDESDEARAAVLAAAVEAKQQVFLEWTYDNSSEEWWVHDPTCFPTLEQARHFVVLYLGDEATAAAVDDFLALILDGIPKVHLKWSDWATTHFPIWPSDV